MIAIKSVFRFIPEIALAAALIVHLKFSASNRSC
jgi:hypothetical protein